MKFIEVMAAASHDPARMEALLRLANLTTMLVLGLPVPPVRK